jgi:hypothetical protein
MRRLWYLTRRLWANLLFLGVTVALVWLIGFDLWEDFRQRHAQFEPVREARIIEARCKTGLFVAAFCTIRATGAPRPEGRVDLRYFLIGWSSDDRPLALLRANGPEAPPLRHITTTYGIEHLGARIACGT